MDKRAKLKNILEGKEVRATPGDSEDLLLLSAGVASFSNDWNEPRERTSFRKEWKKSGKMNFSFAQNIHNTWQRMGEERTKENFLSSFYLKKCLRRFFLARYLSDLYPQFKESDYLKAAFYETKTSKETRLRTRFYDLKADENFKEVPFSDEKIEGIISNFCKEHQKEFNQFKNDLKNLEE